MTDPDLTATADTLAKNARRRYDAYLAAKQQLAAATTSVAVSDALETIGKAAHLCAEDVPMLVEALQELLQSKGGAPQPVPTIKEGGQQMMMDQPSDDTLLDDEERDQELFAEAIQAALRQLRGRSVAVAEADVSAALQAAVGVFKAAEEAYADQMLAETGFGGMDVTDRGVRIRLKHAYPLARRMTLAFRELLAAHPGAENYIEQSVTDPDTGDRYVFAVCKPDGQTPHQLRRAAEQQVEQLRGELGAATTEAAELQAVFDLQWTRMQEATALWRAEVPEERGHVIPDLGNLLTWLMKKIPDARSGR